MDDRQSSRPNISEWMSRYSCGGGVNLSSSRKLNHDNEETPPSKIKKTPSVETSLIDYLKHVSEMFYSSQFTGEDEERKIFVRNVFCELEGKEMKLSCLQTQSRLLEALLSAADLTCVCKFLTGLSRDIHFTATHWIASHVLERCIEELRVRCVYGTHLETDSEHLSVTIKKLVDMLTSRFHELIQDSYGSHVLRCVLEMLSGVYVTHIVSGKRNRRDKLEIEKEEKMWDPSSYLLLTLDDICERFYKLIERIFMKPTLKTFLTNTHSSLLIQAAMLIVHKVNREKMHIYVNSVIEFLSDTANTSLIYEVSVVWALQTFIPLLSDDEMKLIYTSLIKPRITDLTLHRQSNHLIQCFIKQCSRKIFVKILKRLSKEFEAILAIGHAGVIVEISKRCVDVEECQVKFVQCLKAAFHSSDDGSKAGRLAGPVLTLLTYDIYFDGTGRPLQAEDINLHGSLILQSLLNFSETGIADSILNLAASEIHTLTCHPQGSHVIDTIFTSSRVGATKKEAVIKKLSGYFSEQASSTYGSRCVETMWQNISLDSKCLIAGELNADKNKLEGIRHGRILLYKFKISHFHANKKEWMDHERSKEERQEKLSKFLQILNESCEKTN